MTMQTTTRRVLMAACLTMIAIAVGAIVAAGSASADPVRPMSAEQAYRASCGHLGVSCAATPGRTRARLAHRARHSPRARRGSPRHRS